MAKDLLADRLPAPVPIWREGLALFEWGMLRYSPTYWGLGVARGDGAAVIPVPGFTGSDAYLFEMRGWLRRIGYRPYASGIGRNADCLDVLAARLATTVQEANDETQRPVHIIGHSLGGVLARGVATMYPDRVASVVTMGSPVRGVRSHPLVLRFSETVRERIQEHRAGDVDSDCFTGDCNCAFVASTQATFPASVPELAIYTKQDGVVAWRYSRHSVPHKDAEVIGTHSGLAFNPAAYRAVARFLARYRAAQAVPPPPPTAAGAAARSEPA